jgi:pyruvate/2-oxoglutarate dehydrogenase complex dihydrolipoamide dehydrogenase (E3) component
MKTQYTHDIIVIGAGSGGLNIASFMNKSGFKVLLIDKSDEGIGGDCLNFGCIPSKALIHTSRLLHHAKESERFGLSVKGKANIKSITSYIKSKQDIIREHENTAFLRKSGIDIELGKAKFSSTNSIKINNEEFSARKIVLATGSSPITPKIQGLENLSYYNNENIFNIKKLPSRLLIIGGGPIGVEIAQAFQRLGSQVIVLLRSHNFLPKEDPEISNILLKKLKSEGIQFQFETNPIKFTSKNTLIVEKDKKQDQIRFDTLFVAVGRKLNLENLNLEKAGIKITEDKKKVKVNQYLQTTNRSVFLCGDIAGSYQFTHAAELHASIILRNFFSPFKKKLSNDYLSWVTFTDPEIATFGLNEQQLKARSIKYEKLSHDLKYDDRALVDEATEGKLIIYISKNKILGGTLIANNAGEMAQELILALSSNLDIKHIFNKIYPYPTASRINKTTLSQHFAKKLTPLNKKLLHFLY